jgi:Zn-dependent peptidase ImmA (M78 family)
VIGAGRVDALVAAAETLDALDIDQSRVIDPFAAIDRLGLALRISKLDNLLGAVVRAGSGGVLVTSERSPAIQRYTAAHEIGHWILHEGHVTVDSYAEVLGRPSSSIEREAQLFAGYFLMPTPLFDQAVLFYDLQAGEIAAEQVYRLSRDLDVSYEAAARRLHAARLLERGDLQEILRVGRMRAMAQASGGRRPADGLADMWTVTIDEDVVDLVVEERDEVLVDLPEQRLSGWMWQTREQLDRRDSGAARLRPVAPSFDSAAGVNHGHDASAPAVGPIETVAPPEPRPAAVVQSTFLGNQQPESPTQLKRRRRALATSRDSLQGTELPSPAVLIGGTGIRTLVLRTSTPGDWNLELFYAHAYDPNQEPRLSYELRLAIQPTPNTAFRAALLGSDLDRRLPGDPDDEAEFE